MTALPVALLSLQSPLQANLVFSDDFRDGNRDGWSLVGDDAYNDLLVVDGALRLLDSDDADNNFTAVASFPIADLTLAGAKLTLKLDFQNTKDHKLNRGIAIGLYHSEGTGIKADQAIGGADTDDSGYFLYLRRNPFLHRLYENNGKGLSSTTGAIANRANDDENPRIRSGGDAKGASVFGLADGTWHRFKLEIEAILGRDGEVDHLVTVTVDAGRATESVITYQDGGALVSYFDQVGLTAMAGNEFMVDNITVSYTK